jgi:TetR/AcrR family transcriptional regulator, lmrAB and yxaGH operons repressor
VPKAGDPRAQLVATMARLLRDQGYTATGLSQVLAESGVSNGSLYHHFPGGMEELAETALDASGQTVADALAQALDGAPNAGLGVGRFLDMAAALFTEDGCGGCPVAPTALESPLISPRLRDVAARCFHSWEGLIAERLRADGWPEDSVPGAASAALALIEGALLVARVSGQLDHLANARRAALVLLAEPPGQPWSKRPGPR